MLAIANPHENLISSKECVASILNKCCINSKYGH